MLTRNDAGMCRMIEDGDPARARQVLQAMILVKGKIHAPGESKNIKMYRVEGVCRVHVLCHGMVISTEGIYHDEACFQGPPILSTLATECDPESMEISLLSRCTPRLIRGPNSKVGHLGSDKNGFLPFLSTRDFLSSHFLRAVWRRSMSITWAVRMGLGYSIPGEHWSRCSVVHGG